MGKVKAKEIRHAGGRPATYTLCDFGRTLKARLDNRDWSRNDLAKATGLNASTLWRWMVGLASPPIDKVVVIAAAVGCPAADLLPKKPR